MSDSSLVWTLFEPLLAGGLASLLIVIRRWWLKGTGANYWLGLGALAVMSAGLILEGVLAWQAGGTTTLGALDLRLAISPASRLGVLAANAALLCALFLDWAEGDPRGTRPAWSIIAASLVSSLLAGALLIDDRAMQALCLLLAAVAVILALGSASVPPGHYTDEELHADLATGLTGALKQVSLAVVGTGLLVVGALLLARYPLNLENRGLLQVGTALLALGILVRAGVMPFAAAAGDLVQVAPSAALIALGAIAPAALIAGLLMLGPIEGSLVGSAPAAWLGALGAVLAGIRALGAATQSRKESSELRSRIQAHSALTGMTFALQASWALFGVLAESRLGAVGALLLALNMALAGGLLLLGRDSPMALAAGVLSLLGLPPLGGFVGSLLVAQAAANTGGLWLALLLLGSLLTAAAWLIAGRPEWEAAFLSRGWLQVPLVLVLLLIIVQLGLFLAGGTLANTLSAWATVPWLAGP